LAHDKTDVKGRNSRYSDEEINSKASDGAIMETIIAPAGSLIIFDVSHVHRGAPCKNKERYSLTLYFGTSLKSTTCSSVPGEARHKKAIP